MNFDPLRIGGGFHEGVGETNAFIRFKMFLTRRLSKEKKNYESRNFKII